MKRNLSFAAFVLLAMAMTFSLASCGGDDEEELVKAITGAAGTADNPQTPNDPEGTITVNIRNKNNGGTEVSLGGGSLKIDEADNFTCSSSSGKFVSLGKVNGLAAIKSIPASGWSEKVAVVPGYGYVMKIGLLYARLYVVDYMESTSGGIIGAIVKYQSPWDPYGSSGPDVSATGTENGHSWVDLGLPSGTKWATCNVGADSPEKYGSYFAWGETVPKSDYSWSTYKHCKGSYETMTKYCNKSNYGYNGFTDTKTTLDLTDDAARANWQGDWRMPTQADFNELINNTVCIWTDNYKGTGVKGCYFTSTNGKALFLPAAGNRDGTSLGYAGSYGYYWSSTLLASRPYYAYYLFFGSDGVYVYGYYRYFGHTVRPVRRP